MSSTISYQVVRLSPDEKRTLLLEIHEFDKSLRKYKFVRGVKIREIAKHFGVIDAVVYRCLSFNSCEKHSNFSEAFFKMAKAQIAAHNESVAEMVASLTA